MGRGCQCRNAGESRDLGREAGCSGARQLVVIPSNVTVTKLQPITGPRHTLDQSQPSFLPAPPRPQQQRSRRRGLLAAPELKLSYNSAINLNYSQPSLIELQTKVCEDFTITEKAPTRPFSLGAYQCFHI